MIELAEDNAHLYLWATNNYLEPAFVIMREWGFRPVTVITWGKDKFGLGQYFRGQTEHCIFGVRGSLPYKTVDGKRQQGTTLLLAPRRGHSRKPEKMRQIIEKVSYPPYIELFARERVPGWNAWGNEAGEEINVSDIKISGGQMEIGAVDTLFFPST